MAQRRYKSNSDEIHYSESKQTYPSHQSQRYNNTSSAYDYVAEEQESPVRRVRRVRKVKRGTKQVFIQIRIRLPGRRFFYLQA